MEKIISNLISAITANIDPIALILVILGGLFAKNYLKNPPVTPGKLRAVWMNIPTAWKTLIMGSIFMLGWVAVQWASGNLTRKELPKLFFTYCAATSLYELILTYAFDWLAKKGIKIPNGPITCLLIGMLFLSSCMTQKRAVRYFQDHAFAAASYCSTAFPIKDSTVYLPGRQVVLPGDTILIPGQTVPCPPPPAKQVVHCPDSRLITDTLLRTDTITLWRENTAKTTAMTLTVARLRTDSIKTVTALITSKAKATHRGWLMWGTWIILFLIIVGYIFVKSRTALLSSVISGIKGKL